MGRAGTAMPTLSMDWRKGRVVHLRASGGRGVVRSLFNILIKPVKLEEIKLAEIRLQCFYSDFNSELNTTGLQRQ